MTAIVDYALAYAKRGWSVFPLQPRSKIPAVLWLQFNREAPTEDMIRRWWSDCPIYNIAIVTGAISGIFVVDCDNAQMVEGHESLPDYVPTLSSKTAHGRHFIYQHPGHRVRNQVGNGIDIRGDNGYIVTPPSIHPSGAQYRWIKAPVQTAPRAIRELIAPPARQQRINPAGGTGSGKSGTWARVILEREVQAVALASKGLRNNALNRAAYNMGQLIGDGLITRGVVENALMLAGEDAGLGLTEICKTLKSGLDAGISNPRSLRRR